MILRFPDEIKKLEKIFNPYLIGCHLKENAPEEAKDAFERYKAWIENALE